MKETTHMKHRNDGNRNALRELALQVAEEIVAENGLEGLSVRKIALAIGYSVGSLYLIFHNLDDLILQVNARTLDKLYTVLSNTKEQPYTQPKACVLALSQAYFRFATEHSLSWRMIFEHSLPKNTQIPGWYLNKILQLSKIIEKPLQEMMPISDAQACTQAAHTLWGGIHGICILIVTNRFDTTDEDPINWINFFVDTYLSGLKA